MTVEQLKDKVCGLPEEINDPGQVIYDLIEDVLSLPSPQAEGMAGEETDWRMLYQVTEMQRKEWADLCINKAQEIDRLRALLENQFIKYWRDAGHVFKNEPLSELLAMFKKEHNLSPPHPIQPNT